ncbi:hypothetical protein, partial [Methylobacterium crusticola]|uniref:hypothetical protein n=1 Tax=Methylobacterium crusticola TaxID=1697972 RepID=UPI001EE218CE
MLDEHEARADSRPSVNEFLARKPSRPSLWPSRRAAAALDVEKFASMIASRAFSGEVDTGSPQTMRQT